MASLFSKPNALVYVRRSGLIVAGKQIKPARLNFPTGVITNLEVVQASKFLKGCQAFFTDHQLKGKRVLMVLDQSVVFEKSTELNDTSNIEAELERFVAAIPYDAGKRACLYTTDNDLHIYAANYQFYNTLAEALDAAGIAKLLAITPSAAYNLPADQKLGDAIELFIHDTTVRADANFAAIKPL